jgi:hypothetical protein
VLIGLTGFKGSGKDSTGKILVESYGFTQLSFAEPVYQAVWELNPWICTSYNSGAFLRLHDIVNRFGWDQAKRLYPEIRQYLEKVGTEIGRTIIGLDVWVNILDKKVRELSPNTDIVITDARFVNEDWYIHSKGGKLWRVVRRDVGLEGDHSSERGQVDLIVDQTIYNDGDLANLYEKVSAAILRERENLE